MSLRAAAHVVATAAVLLLAYWLAPIQDPLDGRWALRLAVGLLITGLVLWWQITAVRGSARPVQQAAQGFMVSIGVFLIIFASLYLAMDQALTGAFSRSMDKISALYFAITTLGTVGYGDITPVSPVAQIVVSIQMLVDLILLAVIARVFLRTATGAVTRRKAETSVSTMTGGNLLGPAPIQLPEDPAAAALDAGGDVRVIVRDHPDSSLAWAVLAEEALDSGDDAAAYAYARTGYHRGLDRLRRNGWKGAGPVPWAHEPNRGFLRSLSALGHAAAAFDETDEVNRIRAFLLDADPDIPAELLALKPAHRPAATARCACRRSTSPSAGDTAPRRAPRSPGRDACRSARPDRAS